MRRSAAVLVVLPLAGAVAAAARAVDLPPVPTVTAPTVTTPPVSTPVATVPSVSVPSATVPPITTVPAPRVPSPAPTVPTPTSPASPSSPHVPVATAAETTSSAAGAASAHPSSSATSSARPLDTAPTARGTRRSSAAARAVHHPVVARFRLQRRGILHVSVWQQAPRCRFIGRYTEPVTRGANVLRLRRRVDGHRLGVGSYRFVALAFGRQLLDVRVRFVRTRRSLLAVRRTGVEDVCTSQAFATFSAAIVEAVPPLAGNGAAATTGGGRASGATHAPGAKSAAGPTAPYRPPALTRPSPALSSGTSRALLLSLLVVAAALLALGSLPERAPVGGAIARHRAAVGAGGLALLITAAILLFA